MRQFIQLDENGSPKTWPIPATAMHGFAPKGTGFPEDCSGCDLSEFGFETLEPTEPPAFNPETHFARETEPVKVDGSWVQGWKVEKLSTADLSVRRESMAPLVIAAWKGRAALRARGLYDGAVAALADIPDKTARAVAVSYFEGATEWRRDSPLLDGIGIKDKASLFIEAESYGAE